MRASFSNSRDLASASRRAQQFSTLDFPAEIDAFVAESDATCHRRGMRCQFSRTLTSGAKVPGAVREMKGRGVYKYRSDPWRKQFSSKRGGHGRYESVLLSF